jgi:hypothetical protein
VAALERVGRLALDVQALDSGHSWSGRGDRI